MRLNPPFVDRADAGRKLAERLQHLARRPDLLVLGLARGGLPVAFEIAARLQAELDVLVVRKLGVPDQEELAMGAIAPGGFRFLHQQVIRALHIPEAVIAQVTESEMRELERREQLYRAGRKAIAATGRTVIVVDDGLATGSTMQAAIAALRAQQPAWLVMAVPVGAPAVVDALRPLVEESVCLMTPEDLASVGLWYHDFSQTSDAEVGRLLAAARHGQAT